MFDKLKEQKELYTITIGKALTRSREILTQYVAMGSAFLTQYGNQILDAFNVNSPQIQTTLPKFFGVLSGLCALLAIYLKLTTKSVVVSKNAEEPVIVEKINEVK